MTSAPQKRKKEKKVVAELWGPLQTLDGKNDLFYAIRCEKPDVSMKYSIWAHGAVRESDLDA